MIGADGPLTFKNAAKLPEIVAKCPRDYLLLETDAPYMAPVPKRGKTNEPSFLPHIAAKVAELWNVPLEEVARQTTANALNLYTKLNRDEK
jgi:TatD DNase family protein